MHSRTMHSRFTCSRSETAGRRFAPRRAAHLLAAAVLLATAACASGRRTGPVDTKARALVYGNIESSKPVQAVELVQAGKVYAAGINPRPSAELTEQGDFFFRDVEPGQYFLMRFMAGGRWYILMNGDRANNLSLRFDAVPGGVHYVGAYRVTGEKDNTFSPDQFSFARVSSPGEGQVRRRIAPELAGSGWERKLAAGPRRGAKRGS